MSGRSGTPTCRGRRTCSVRGSAAASRLDSAGSWTRSRVPASWPRSTVERSGSLPTTRSVTTSRSSTSRPPSAGRGLAPRCSTLGAGVRLGEPRRPRQPHDRRHPGPHPLGLHLRTGRGRDAGRGDLAHPPPLSRTGGSDAGGFRPPDPQLHPCHRRHSRQAQGQVRGLSGGTRNCRRFWRIRYACGGESSRTRDCAGRATSSRWWSRSWGRHGRSRPVASGCRRCCRTGHRRWQPGPGRPARRPG